MSLPDEWVAAYRGSLQWFLDEGLEFGAVKVCPAPYDCPMCRPEKRYCIASRCVLRYPVVDEGLDRLR